MKTVRKDNFLTIMNVKNVQLVGGRVSYLSLYVNFASQEDTHRTLLQPLPKTMEQLPLLMSNMSVLYVQVVVMPLVLL